MEYNNLYFYGAFTHTLRWDRMGWNKMGCAGNAMNFNGRVHT